MNLISNGLELNEMFSIMNELLLTRQYKALADLLQNKSFDFGSVYNLVCAKIMTVDHVKEIIRTQTFKDQTFLLSDHCIKNSNSIWTGMTRNVIMTLPVSPLSNSEFSPIKVPRMTFYNILEHALIVSIDPMRKTVDFYSWLRDAKTLPKSYFRLILPIMNPIMFYLSSNAHQIWFLSCLGAHLTNLLKNVPSGDSDRFWLGLLKLSVLLRSIFLSRHMYTTISHNKEILTMINQISDFVIFMNSEIINEFGNSMIKLLKEVSIYSNYSSPKLMDVFDAFIGNKHPLHPDWLIGLLLCNFPGDSKDYSKILVYISSRNPHITTIDILTFIFANNLNSNLGRRFPEIFGQTKMMENPSKAYTRPLQLRFKDLRGKNMKLINQFHRDIIFDLLNDQFKPENLFLDVLEGFRNNVIQYSENYNYLLVLSPDHFGRINNINFSVFLSKIFSSFLKLSELYVLNDSANSLIFSPIIPNSHLHLLINFIMHNSLLWEIPTPFKIFKKYFYASVRGCIQDLELIYQENSVFFELSFLKISKIFKNEYWYRSTEYFSTILLNYSNIRLIKDDDIKIGDVSEDARSWLKQSFLKNSLAIRSLIYNHFEITKFLHSEIYYILFEK